MKSPRTMIREYEMTRNVGTALRLYTYVRPRKDGEATVEVWGAKNNMRRKGRPVGYKCFFKFRTEDDRYAVRDVLHYTSWSRMMHDHLCYHAPEIGGMDYSFRLGEENGKWLYNFVSETEKPFLPRYCTMLNDFKDTKYRYCGYDAMCGMSVMSYLELYRKFPIVEILSKSKNFQLLEEKFLVRVTANKELARFVAKNHAEITLHHMSRPEIERLFRASAGTESIVAYRKMLKDAKAAERALERQREAERIEREYENLRGSLRKWDKKVKEMYRRIKAICGQYGCYEVEVPKSSEDFVREGIAMHNCVGKCYCSNHAMGHDVIVFLRKDGKPCVDLRIDPVAMEIKECRFVCNKDATHDKSVMREAEKVRDNLAKVWKEVA